jgi:hypothetical protein
MRSREVRARPADDARQRRGGACAADRLVPRLPPSGRARPGRNGGALGRRRSRTGTSGLCARSAGAEGWIWWSAELLASATIASRRCTENKMKFTQGLAVVVIGIAGAANAQSTSPEPYATTGGWARAIYRLNGAGYQQVGPLLFLPNDVDCLAEAKRITEAMEMRQRPPGCNSMSWTPYYFVSCTRFGEVASGRIFQR